MSFSIERYKEESKKLDTSGVDWDAVAAHPLSKGDLFCLHYMMDIENYVPLYLSHLLVTRACMDPILTAFLACWNYEELWHGESIGKLLNLYGIEFDTQDRIASVRANLGFQNSISILSTMAGSWLLKDFSAVYLTIGAINELTTLTGYGALIRKSGHPVLRDLLGRIIKDERRHFAFYYNSAKEWLTDNPRRSESIGGCSTAYGCLSARVSRSRKRSTRSPCTYSTTSRARKSCSQSTRRSASCLDLTASSSCRKRFIRRANASTKTRAGPGASSSRSSGLWRPSASLRSVS